MELSIIIVNWNSKYYIRNCIRSIIKSVKNIEFEIIVIDAGSFDGSEEVLNYDFPYITFIQHPENCGFAKANNIAFSKSNGNHVIFLNPDTIVLNNAINVLLDTYKEKKNIGVIGAKLYNADMSIQTSCAQSFPTILNQVLDSEILRNIFKKSTLWGNYDLYKKDNNIFEVDAISGACILTKREIFKKIDGFNEIYFMYSEDIDLCYKIKNMKLRNYINPNAKIIHYGGGSTNGKINIQSLFMMIDSRFKYFSKYFSKEYSIAFRIAIMITSFMRLYILILASKVSKNNDYYEKAILKWKVKAKWSMGLVNTK